MAEYATGTALSRGQGAQMKSKKDKALQFGQLLADKLGSEVVVAVPKPQKSKRSHQPYMNDGDQTRDHDGGW